MIRGALLLAGAAAATGCETLPELLDSGRGDAGTPRVARPRTAAEIVTRGEAPRELARFDDAMKTFMAKRGITAGQLAVARKGHLLLARGYGAAAGPAVEPTTLFRIASLSKHITAAAVLRLAQRGKVRLDDPVKDLLGLRPAPGGEMDHRLKDVTVRRLLEHSGGWDMRVSGDPVFLGREDALRLGDALGLGGRLPIGREDVIRYVTGRRLDFTPGLRTAYGNYGYLLLGRVVEKASGRPYAAYVTEELLAPLGITRMRLGRSRREHTPGEVAYESEEMVTTVLDDSGERVPAPYGGVNLELGDSAAGWVASAVDLLRFQRVFDPEAGLLTRGSIRSAFAKPEPGPQEDGWWYGKGWFVREAEGGLDAWHEGGLAGAYTHLYRRHDGVAYAAFFNRSEAEGEADYDIGLALRDTAGAIRTWPGTDLTPRYF
ncbi:class A beta-lactamase-related serine hydrolase [Bailinhaonella thermotolerans]|uniref:Class A beta-lactamase-related serine hydrolase n=1 Tax=Bailinhaonella thermotolerans TaxID=1070861 RepID=A0A3A4A814_9ACTN|nr:class A beta-lactamase-related serine hydrolase [Bailinhaonella thermotolerans]